MRPTFVRLLPERWTVFYRTCVLSYMCWCDQGQSWGKSLGQRAGKEPRAELGQRPPLGREKAGMTYEGTRFFPVCSFDKEKGISSIKHCTKMFSIHSSLKENNAKIYKLVIQKKNQVLGVGSTGSRTHLQTKQLTSYKCHAVEWDCFGIGRMLVCDSLAIIAICLHDLGDSIGLVRIGWQSNGYIVFRY